jgi:hypothetical protein
MVFIGQNKKFSKILQRVVVFEGFALFPGAGMELVAQFRLAQLCYVLLFMAVVGSGFLGSTPRQLVCDCGGGCCGQCL